MKKLLVYFLIFTTVFSVFGCSTANYKITESDFECGYWKNNVFSSDFSGLSFKLPSGWRYMTNKERAEIMNISTSIANNKSKFKLAAINTSPIYDMAAEDPTATASIYIMYENLALAETEVKQTLEEYAVNFKKIVEESSTLQECSEIYEESIGNEKYTSFSSIYDEVLTKKYLMREIGDFIVVIIISGGLSDNSHFCDNYHNYLSGK